MIDKSKFKYKVGETFTSAVDGGLFRVVAVYPHSGESHPYLCRIGDSEIFFRFAEEDIESFKNKEVNHGSN